MALLLITITATPVMKMKNKALKKNSDFFIHGHFGVLSYTKAKIIAMTRVVIHSSILYHHFIGGDFFFHFTWKKPKSLSWVCAAPLSQAQPEKSAFLDNLHLKFSARITSILTPSPGGGCLASQPQLQDTRAPGWQQHRLGK